ncbi:MAG: glycoside hydrolase family 113 [Tepidisphaeraceae bacterium]
MVRKLMLAGSIALYLVVLGCSLRPPVLAQVPADDDTAAPTTYPTTMAEGLPYRCIGMQIQRVDWMDKYKKSVDEIAALGADTVKFVVDARQENGESSHIYLDMRMTPTPDQLGDLIRYAKKKNLRVVLMPIVLLDAPRGTEWRGRISPDNWDEWWKSYRDILTHFAWIAQGNGVDILVVGSELISTESYTAEWTNTINQVRTVFKGKLTYSSNWDHYTAIHFWDQLDFIGMNSYWTLGSSEHASIDEIKGNWQDIQKELFKFQAKVHKPLFFLEVGWCSMANMAKEPWDYTKTESEAPTDDALQARLYEAFFESWYGKPQLGGFSIWEWTPAPDPDNPDSVEEAVRGYTPKGKPAEKVLRQWLAKKW